MFYNNSNKNDYLLPRLHVHHFPQICFLVIWVGFKNVIHKRAGRFAITEDFQRKVMLTIRDFQWEDQVPSV